MSFFKYIDGGYIESWCRVTEWRSHDIRNKDIIYPSVVLYNYKVVNLEIYPSKIRIRFSFTHCSSTISNMLTATMVAFHSIWIRERASFSTPELTLWTPLLREELWCRKWIRTERIRCARMHLLSFMTTGDDKRLTVVSARRKKLCRVPLGLMTVICNTTKACSSKHPHSFFI